MGRASVIDTTLPAIDELAALGDRFVAWRWETRNGKATKPPIDPRTGGYANTTDPRTWSDLGTAMAAAEKYRLDGVGVTIDADRDGIVGIDLDGCRDASTGEIADWATRIIRNINSYTEISPSGTGAKIYCRADPVPKLAANKRTVGKVNGTKPPGVEVYSSGRYFCLTGQMLDGTPDEIVDSTAALEQLAAWIAKVKPAPELPAEFAAMLERDAKLREAWETGAKIGHGGDTSASGLDWSLACYLRSHLDDAGLEAVLRCYQHGQIGSGRLKGAAAERRIARILDEIGPRQKKGEAGEELPPLDRSDPDRVDWAKYVGIRPPPPAFMTEGIVPRQAITGVFGMDGLGKSLFGQQTMTTMAIGADVFGHKVVERGKTLGWFCEESAAIIAYRQEAINRPLGITFGNLEAIGFEARARLGMDNLLVRMVNDIAEPTPTFWRLREYCLQQAVKTLWLDHILHIVAGDITRPEIVTKMLGVLSKLSIDMDGAVIIAGHVAKAADSQYLGSVMFSALVRSRMWLRKPSAEELAGRPICDHVSLRVLELAKANHAPLGQVMLQWHEGAFIAADGAASTEERTRRERHAESVFIRALRELDQRQRSVDTKGTYAAHRTIVDYDVNEGLTAPELQEAMKRLIKSRRIKVGIEKPWKKDNRLPARGLGFAEDAQ